MLYITRRAFMLGLKCNATQGLLVSFASSDLVDCGSYCTKLFVLEILALNRSFDYPFIRGSSFLMWAIMRNVE